MTTRITAGKFHFRFQFLIRNRQAWRWCVGEEPLRSQRSTISCRPVRPIGSFHLAQVLPTETLLENRYYRIPILFREKEPLPVSRLLLTRLRRRKLFLLEILFVDLPMIDPRFVLRQLRKSPGLLARVDQDRLISRPAGL
jgi:hypothetical protein